MSAASAAGGVLLEARPFRPFKSSEEYLYAMKEDLAEWLTVLYPELMITADNFLDRLDTGVALCRHANAVRESARLLLEKAECAESEEALSLARALRSRLPVSLLPAARPGTFFARDNLSNFIEWCRRALGVLECLLFETDDLCLRKNEKHVVLCLLEVARRGAVLGMPAPLLVLMERQIERELAGEESPADHGALGLVPAGPQQQVVTNDLRSLDERVRDLLARCSCPTQFPMVRVSEGKYRIGDTKLLIFVRVGNLSLDMSRNPPVLSQCEEELTNKLRKSQCFILRSHVMVRVGGGWDTLAHYLDKHDPCRCRAQHRAPLAARISRSQRPYADLSGATVLYERAEPASLPCAPPAAARHAPPASLQYHAGYRPAYSEAPASLPYLGDLSDARRRSSSPERPARLNKAPLAAHLSPSRSIRTRSDSPGGAGGAGGRKSASPEGERRMRGAGVVSSAHLVPSPHASRTRSPRPASPAPPAAESASDNGSEVSDEGYRSLGVVSSAQGSPSAPARPLPAAAAASNRHSLHSQHSADDADYSERLDNDDGCHMERVDEHVSLNTGLRKTDYSHTLYGGKKQPAGGGGEERPARASPERVSTESNHSPSKSLRQHQPSRIPHSPVRARTPTRADTPSPKRPLPPTQTSPKSAPRLPPAARNTWGGRTAPGQARSKARPTVAADTFDNPNKSPKSRARAPAAAAAASSAASPTEAFKRNSPLRASSATLRSTPSPNGKPLSPLLEQILRSTETAKDDASVLEKMKDIIRQYSTGNGDSLSRSSSKDSDYADFTSAWVMSDGKLERSTSTRQLAAPRRDARATPSRIPAPLACRRSTSTAHFQ